MKMKLFFILTLAVSSYATALTANLDASGTSEFIATGKPGFIKIDAKGTGLTGKIKVTDDMVSGDATFPLNTLDSGVSLRDRHLKEEYLQVQKFPNAQLTFNQVMVSKNPEENGYNQKNVPFAGVLTVHGVSHPVNGTIDLSTASGTTQGDAQFGIKISDFGFAEPKFMGMKVNDDVLVKVHLVATKVKAG
jgi:polyisoprenoid-binding protein YceI